MPEGWRAVWLEEGVAGARCGTVWRSVAVDGEGVDGGGVVAGGARTGVWRDEFVEGCGWRGVPCFAEAEAVQHTCSVVYVSGC